jgi:hypothetical protein
MRFVHASAFALCMLTAAPVGSFAVDPKSDVRVAYAAWDAAFNQGDAKAVATASLPSANLFAPIPRGGAGSSGQTFAGSDEGANALPRHALVSRLGCSTGA